mmetsp:Transcript_37366/g.108013  ORF Transcript_37366/g.108013 Transcript_37366/m.108013 type:complete len:217 (-) Transcript_37366:93-743(-)
MCRQPRLSVPVRCTPCLLISVTPNARLCRACFPERLRQRHGRLAAAAAWQPFLPKDRRWLRSRCRPMLESGVSSFSSTPNPPKMRRSRGRRPISGGHTRTLLSMPFRGWMCHRRLSPQQDQSHFRCCPVPAAAATSPRGRSHQKPAPTRSSRHRSAGFAPAATACQRDGRPLSTVSAATLTTGMYLPGRRNGSVRASLLRPGRRYSLMTFGRPGVR